MTKQELIDLGKSVFTSNYAQLPLVLEKGEGCRVTDNEGREYLDFVAGISTNALGYGYKPYVDALKDQLDKLVHCSNLYWNEPSIMAAKKLVDISGLGKVFFCNSGAEANEAAIKMARKYVKEQVDEKRYKIISMQASFHGRTIATVSATGQPKYHKGFSPLLPGIEYAVFNDLDSVKDLVDDETAAIIIEPVQGEGGIHPAELSFLKGLRDLCDKHGLVLIFDEVQCGMGRLGEVFAYQHFGVKPDIVSIAKGLGGGVPVGGIVASDKVAVAFTPGTHASTFGGNPFVTTGVNGVLDALTMDGILDNVQASGAYLTEKLNWLKYKYDVIVDVRGIGFLQGIELSVPVIDIIKDVMDNGLLLINAGTHIIRFVPPLIAGKDEIDEMIDILDKALERAMN